MSEKEPFFHTSDLVIGAIGTLLLNALHDPDKPMSCETFLGFTLFFGTILIGGFFLLFGFPSSMFSGIVFGAIVLVVAFFIFAAVSEIQFHTYTWRSWLKLGCLCFVALCMLAPLWAPWVNEIVSNPLPILIIVGILIFVPIIVLYKKHKEEHLDAKAADGNPVVDQPAHAPTLTNRTFSRRHH